MFVNGCCLGSCSRGQSVTVFLSGEAELHAIILAALEGIAMHSILRELGHQVAITVLSDSPEARAMRMRLGTGSVKHVETRIFLLQQLIATRMLTIGKVLGDLSVADLGA